MDEIKGFSLEPNEAMRLRSILDKLRFGAGVPMRRVEDADSLLIWLSDYAQHLGERVDELTAKSDELETIQRDLAAVRRVLGVGK